jgi:hypothetical protein
METTLSGVDEVDQPVRRTQAGTHAQGQLCNRKVASEEPSGDTDVRPWAPEGFHVHDETTANWLVRKIRECRAYAARVTAWAASEIHQAQSEERFFWERYGGELERWTAARLSNSKRRSVPLPAGTIGFRQQPPSLLLTDPNALFDWLAVNLPPAVKVTVEVTGGDAEALASWLAAGHCPGASVARHAVRGVLRDHVRATGECPPGVQVAERTAFYVK